ncbi:MAG: ATP-binding cassette domain-containing protein, partial [Alphaproteobacteria bacterium]|nr:ATP-binding cassette domain-containing protein [Alphaproteobacteria bacterium]
MSSVEEVTEHDREPLLEVCNLRVDFTTSRGRLQAVDGISFNLQPGEILGVVGESGCGKSVMARAILGLLPSPPASVSASAMNYQSRGGASLHLTELNKKQFQKVRGKEISMIFQEPMTSLNPVFTIGDQLTEHVI